MKKRKPKGIAVWVALKILKRKRGEKGEWEKSDAERGRAENEIDAFECKGGRPQLHHAEVDHFQFNQIYDSSGEPAIFSENLIMK